ncbi:Pyridinium-3,5-bisthiocarboxylic acid mononucleotide nickel insertion protein [bioreactor metagenome]|uniref:Pyridinium-3,5-bisthiocarboxylic acid mononucleotide nickel insertion protein n=1 Tax=bioreactor metagenome TaxID=1076179 RepID=A0A645FRB6_9ZZZZ
MANSFGKRELLHRPNLLRAMLVETADGMGTEEAVEELACNLDDCTGEVIGYLSERLLKAGALDVWTEAVQMKKQRPGVKLCVLSRPAEREAMLELMFRESTTLGVRIAPLLRRALERRNEEVSTPYGPVRVKIARGGDGAVLSAKPEFDECRKIAETYGIPVKEVLRAASTRVPDGEK